MRRASIEVSRQSLSATPSISVSVPFSADDRLASHFIKYLQMLPERYPIRQALLFPQQLHESAFFSAIVMSQISIGRSSDQFYLLEGRNQTSPLDLSAFVTTETRLRTDQLYVIFNSKHEIDSTEAFAKTAIFRNLLTVKTLMPPNTNKGNDFQKTSAFFSCRQKTLVKETQKGRLRCEFLVGVARLF